MICFNARLFRLDIIYVLIYNKTQIERLGKERIVDLKTNIIADKKDKLILIFIILVQCIFVSVMFGIKKQGYHSDEMWNYALANSSEGRRIEVCDNGDLKNLYEWTDSNEFLKYISVDKSEIFDYKSTYMNALHDYNPPLQNMLLHLVCSFFPDKWSKWYGFFINLLAFVITQIYLYKALKLLCMGEKGAIAGVLLYGFCAGTLEILAFLRIYALGVTFAVAFFYYFTKIYIDSVKTKAERKDFAKLFVICFLGAFTIMQFMVVAFAITLGYLFALLLKKKYKVFFASGLVCLTAVVMAIMASFDTFIKLFQNDTTYAQIQTDGMSKTPVVYQFWSYLSYLTKDNIGIHNELEISFGYMLVCLILGIVFSVFLIICLFSRKKKWFIDMKNNLIEYLKRLFDNIKTETVSLLVLLFTILFFVILNAKITSIEKMGIYSKRYIFMIYPIFVLMVAMLINLISQSLRDKKIIVNLGIALFLAALSLVLADNAFFMPFERKGTRFGDIEKNADCIIVVEDKWLLTLFTGELYDTHSFYALERKEYIQDNYDELESVGGPLYLFLDVSKECLSKDESDILMAKASGGMINKDEILDYYKNLPISSKCELVGQEYIHDRRVEIYRLK